MSGHQSSTESKEVNLKVSLRYRLVDAGSQQVTAAVDSPPCKQ